MKIIHLQTFLLFLLFSLNINSTAIAQYKTDYQKLNKINSQFNQTAIEFSKQLGIGWNLGNSLEAINKTKEKLIGDETAWGNPFITKQLIDSVKAAGFNTVRIPVSWSHQLIDKTNMVINKKWLQRVEEVVKYVLDNEMYAIINVHWDGGWADHPFYKHQEEINKRFGAYWGQIATYFKDYNENLLFAGTNEVHIENNWDAPTEENAKVQNSFNQTFVDTVRATGGKNLNRFLIVQGYNTNIQHTINHFNLPKDITNDRLLVEIHYYDPYEFALKEKDGDTMWGKSNENITNWGQEDHVNKAFNSLKNKFVKRGIPVIMGEYGAIRKTVLTGKALTKHLESRKYYLKYITEKALKNGIVPIYWDNGYSANNGFALFDRKTGKQLFPDEISAITNVAKK